MAPLGHARNDAISTIDTLNAELNDTRFDVKYDDKEK